jgi:predicted enzyme involved in methoxymalonyl-ACP biosynthesis
VAQLTQRTNQFNLRTVRYSESDIKAFAEDSSCVTMSVSLKDAYGSYGIIGAAILRGDTAPAAGAGADADRSGGGSGALFLDTWLMSCRAVKRGVEEFFFNHMVSAAKALGYERIIAEYIPTEKNSPSRDILPNMGFKSIGGAGASNRMELLLDSYAPKPSFIKEEA